MSKAEGPSAREFYYANQETCHPWLEPFSFAEAYHSFLVSHSQPFSLEQFVDACADIGVTESDAKAIVLRCHHKGVFRIGPDWKIGRGAIISPDTEEEPASDVIAEARQFLEKHEFIPEPNHLYDHSGGGDCRGEKQAKREP